MDIDKSISTAHAAHSGWNVENHESGTPFDTAKFYITNHDSGDVRLMTVPVEHLKDMEVDEPMAVLTSALGLAYRDYEKNPCDASINRLTQIIVAYALKTHAYRHWLSLGHEHSRLHFFINVYSNGGSFRPFIAKSDDKIIDGDLVMEQAIAVAHGDKKAHPEWFK